MFDHIHFLFVFAAFADAAFISLNGTISSKPTSATSTAASAATSSSVSITSISAPDPPITSSAQLSYTPATGTQDKCFWNDIVKSWVVVERSGTTAALLGGTEFVNPFTAEAASNTTIQSFCSSAFVKSLSDWYSTVPLVAWTTAAGITTTVPPSTYIYTWPGCESVSGMDVLTTYTDSETNTGFYTETIGIETKYMVGSSFSYTATAPCCDQCHIFGGDVQVYFWPTSAVSPPVSILSDSAGFEFISPSIYVAFRSLYASDRCGAVELSHTPTTIAFSEGELSTAIGYYWDTEAYKNYPPYFDTAKEFTAATWGTEICSDIRDTFYQVGVAGLWEPNTETYKDLSAVSSKFDFDWYLANGWIHKFTVTHNPCSPTISVPTQLYSIDSLWSSCGNVLSGLYDPPYVLTKGSGLQPVSPTVAPPIITPSAGAISPAGTPTPVTPMMTSTPTPSPNPKPVTSMSKNDPPTETSSPATNDPILIQIPPSPSNNDPSPRPNDPTAVQDPPTPTTPSPPTHSLTAVIIGTQTLLPGGPEVIISGTSLSLQSDFSSIMINGHPSPLTAIIPSSNAFVIASQTLIPGGAAITVSGTKVSLESGGSSVVIGGSETMALSSFLGGTTVTASFVGIGGIIATIGGFGAVPSVTYVQGGGNGGYDGPVFEGGAGLWRGGVGFGVWRWFVVLGVGWMIR